MILEGMLKQLQSDFISKNAHNMYPRKYLVDMRVLSISLYMLRSQSKSIGVPVDRNFSMNLLNGNYNKTFI